MEGSARFFLRPYHRSAVCAARYFHSIPKEKERQREGKKKKERKKERKKEKKKFKLDSLFYHILQLKHVYRVFPLTKIGT